MVGPIIIFAIGLVLVLAVPPFLDYKIKAKGKRRSFKMLSKILGWLLVFLGIYSLISNLVGF